MTTGILHCSRCNEALGDDVLVVALEKERPEFVPPDLKLCSRCAESFGRWYERGGKSVSKGTSNGPSRHMSPAADALGSKHSTRRHRHQKKKMHPLVRTLLVTTITIVLFALAFYWTWAILKRATRPEE
jgi:hypothetical protein